MITCNKCNKDYCESCGCTEQCYNNCEYARHTVVPGIAGNEFLYLTGKNICCKCYINNDFSHISSMCNNKCNIFTAISLSYTKWHCDKHKPF